MHGQSIHSQHLTVHRLTVDQLNDLIEEIWALSSTKQQAAKLLARSDQKHKRAQDFNFLKEIDAKPDSGSIDGVAAGILVTLGSKIAYDIWRELILPAIKARLPNRVE